MLARLPRTPRAVLIGTTLLLALIGAASTVQAKSVTRRETHFSFSNGYDDHLAWALIDGDLNSASGSGETGDFEEARAIARRHGEVLWARIGDTRYVIQDPELLRRAREALEPSELLGKEQGRLGAKQGELGRRQGELGRRQGEIGRRQGLLASEQARLQERVERARDRGVSSDAMEDRIEQISREMQGLSREMDELSDLQNQLSEQQQPLSEKQSEMGRQQQKYQEELRSTMRELIDGAIREGKAERLR